MIGRDEVESGRESDTLRSLYEVPDGAYVISQDDVWPLARSAWR
jgi:hypothetical protein